MADDDDEKKAVQRRAVQVAAQEEINKAANPPGSGESAPLPTSVPTTPSAVPPAVPAAIPNPLTVGSTFDASIGSSGAPTPINPEVMRPVDVAANRYRDIATTGTPEEKAQALADYKATIQYKPPSVAERYDPQKWADFNQAQYAKYTSTGPDRWLDNPFRIGSGQAQLPVTSTLADAEQLGRRGISATPIRQETAGLAQANQAASNYQQMLQNAQGLESPTIDAKGRRKPASATDLAQAALWRQRAFEHGTESGLIDPNNPTAGADIDRARALAIITPRLAKDPSTLTALATTPQPQSVTDSGGDLNAAIARNQLSADQVAQILARQRAYAYNE